MSHLIWYPGHERILDRIVRASGCWFEDDAGRRYLDLESGVWCTSIGHGHPRVLRALREQSETILHNGFNYSSPVVEESAREILESFGIEGGRCVFLCSGSEAVEYGVRVAQMLTDRSLFLTMHDSYFGAYGSAARRYSEEWFTYDWLACSACAGDRGCMGGCEAFASIPFDRIGAFLFEPGSSSGLVRFPSVELIRAIVERVRGDGGFYLVNEVTTGIGRTGRWFGHQHYEPVPDLIATGKGIGNGYPVSAALFGPAITERLGTREVRYAQSHQNDPLGAVVAREVVRVIRDEGLIESARELGDRMLSGLRAIAARRARVGEVRGRGLMAAVELRGDDPANAADGADAGDPVEAAHAVQATLRVHRTLLEQGFAVGRRPGVPVLRIDPPLTLSPGDLDWFLEALDAVLGSEE